MIIDNRLTTYIHSLEKENPPFTEGLRRCAEENDVPVIRRETESLIRVLLMLKKPANILEIGTAIGYSAVFMAQNSEAHITTIENYEKRIKEAKKNIADAGLENRISLLEGDACRLLKDIDGSYDMVFLDAAKGQYIEMLPDILRLLPEEGILLADNVLQEGELIESRFITERRQRTIHERMREFLWEVKHNSLLETCVLTTGDGVSLSIKRASDPA